MTLQKKSLQEKLPLLRYHLRQDFKQVQTQPSNPYTFYRSDNATDPVELEEMRNNSEEVLPVQGSVVGMFLKRDDGSVIPVKNTDELIRIEIPNKEERLINVRSNAYKLFTIKMDQP